MTQHFITSACTRCDACAAVCPTASISFGATQYVIDQDTCTGCEICVSVCPVDVIVPAQAQGPN